MLINVLKISIPQWLQKRKVIRNPYPGQDDHQKLITSSGSPLAHAYHTRSTSVTAIVSYPAQNNRQNDRKTDHITRQTDHASAAHTMHQGQQQPHTTQLRDLEI